MLPGQTTFECKRCFHLAGAYNGETAYSLFSVCRLCHLEEQRLIDLTFNVLILLFFFVSLVLIHHVVYDAAKFLSAICVALVLGYGVYYCIEFYNYINDKEVRLKNKKTR